ncbi:MAG: hypothetical protein HY048_06650 [Acidobacteria bacterium]|nr:hypothetical protein [Acidobacteriota bacterium]
MKRSAVILVTVGAVVVVVVGGFVTLRRTLGIFGGGGKDQVSVQLTMQGDVCSVRGPVDDLGGAWKNKVQWNIDNTCDAPQYVSFLEYREDFGGGNYGSIEPRGSVVDPDPANSPQVLRGIPASVVGKIAKLHLSHFGDRRFKYKICVGPNQNPATNCLDPDVDVWPGF